MLGIRGCGANTVEELPYIDDFSCLRLLIK